MDGASSVLQQYDEIIRCTNVLIDGVNLDEMLLCFLKKQQSFIDKYIETTDECKRLKVKLDGANKDISVLENKLASARRWLDAERQLRKRVEEEREALSQQLDEARRILLNDPRYKLNDETKQKLSFLNKPIPNDLNGCGSFSNDRLNTITESESSDMSFSRSADDLDDGLPVVSSNKYRPSFPDDEFISTKRRKSFAVSKSKNHVPPQPYEKSAVEKINARTHSFVTKTYIMPESCSWCSKKIGFGKMVYKCLDCQTIAHLECYEKIPLPCIPMGASPKKCGTGYISDYAPATPPMIPALVVHCINEVERRGLSELGIYRISGMESVIRGLRDKFAKNKGVPCISDVDIHSVCCFLKDFLRNLQEPLIPRNKWQSFSEAITAVKDEKLHHVIDSLPQANRDTLAFLIVHLHNVASSPECRMSISNLATVFGPTIVGYSNAEPMNALTEARTANAIMEALMMLPSNYWSNFIDPVSEPKANYVSIATTGAYTPARKTPKLMRTPGTKRKFFNSSPPLQ